MQELQGREFSLLMALLMSIVSFSIDATLPALGPIARFFALTQANHVQWVITSVFLGMTLGQVLAGPLSDALGRKRILFAGVALYFIGSLLCYRATDFSVFLVGRLIQGLGMSGPYVAALAVVRDKFSGAQMAKVMSVIMMVFMVAPALAPAIGQTIITWAGWRTIFLVYIVYALLTSLWIAWRLDETLAPEHRLPLRWQTFAQGFREVLGHRTTLIYLLCAGLCFGALIAYLGNAQQIFMQQFGLSGGRFSLYFAILAGVTSTASFVNSRIVARFGMRRVTLACMAMVAVISLLFLLLQLNGTATTLRAFMMYAVLLFFAFGVMFGNLNAIAMEPMGHVAGMASAIIGAVSSILSLLLATLIGQLYDNTLIPLTSGFLILFSLAWLLARHENDWQAR